MVFTRRDIIGENLDKVKYDGGLNEQEAKKIKKVTGSINYGVYKSSEKKMIAH